MQMIGYATRTAFFASMDFRFRYENSMRDVLIHNYMGVDLETVWNVVKLNLPDLICDAGGRNRTAHSALAGTFQTNKFNFLFQSLTTG